LFPAAIGQVSCAAAQEGWHPETADGTLKQGNRMCLWLLLRQVKLERASREKAAFLKRESAGDHIMNLVT